MLCAFNFIVVFNCLSHRFHKVQIKSQCHYLNKYKHPPPIPNLFLFNQIVIMVKCESKKVPASNLAFNRLFCSNSYQLRPCNCEVINKYSLKLPYILVYESTPIIL